MDQNQNATLEEELQQANFSLQESDKLYRPREKTKYAFSMGICGILGGAEIDLLFLWDPHYFYDPFLPVAIPGLGFCLGLVYGVASFSKFREDFREKSIKKYTSLLEKVFE